MGLGLFGGGVEVTRLLAGMGAHLTVTDLKDEKPLARSLEKLAGLDIQFHLGGHNEEDFRNADVVLVSPAIPADSPFLEIAECSGAEFETNVQLSMVAPLTCQTKSAPP